MPEITDTNPDIFPEGEYEFVATKVPIKKLGQNSGKPYYQFYFETMVEDSLRDYTEMRMPWQCADLLRAFGFKETKPGVFEWEKTEVPGKRIKAKIVHEADRKDATKKRPRLTEIVESIPF